MIFAPFAVLTFGNMPIVSNIKELSWDNWLKDLTNYALLAPIFVFFLYIIFSFIGTGSGFFEIKNADINNSDFFQNVISITVPLLIIYFMIKQGVSIAEEYAGKIGKGIQNAANAAGGVLAATTVGVASGGLAAVGRGTVGRASSKLANSETLRKWSGSNNWIARKVGSAGVGIGESGSKANFDLRNTGALKMAGVDSGKENKFITKLTRTTTDNTKDGVKGSIDRKEKRGYESMKSFQVTGDMAVARDLKAKAWETQHVDPVLNQWKLQNPVLAKDDFSVKQQKALIVQQAIAGGSGPKPETSEEVNLRRNKAFGARKQNSAVFLKSASRIFGAQGGVLGTTGTIAGNALATTVGAGIMAITGEARTGGVADARVGSNVNKLSSYDADIITLTSDIAPLQNRLLTGTPTPLSRVEIEQLKALKAKLKAVEEKRKSLNEKLTKKD